MTSHNRGWDCVNALMNADPQAPRRVETYLRRTGWTRHPDRGWTTTVDSEPAWLPPIPEDPDTDVPLLPAGVVNGLVQRQLALLDNERVTKVIEVLLCLEILENRSWTQTWCDINGPAQIPTPVPPTLDEQAKRIAADLADLHPYILHLHSIIGRRWPSVSVDLSQEHVITARPALPSEVPEYSSPGDCWSIDLDTPTDTQHAAHTTAAFAAITMRAIAIHTHATNTNHVAAIYHARVTTAYDRRSPAADPSPTPITTPDAQPRTEPEM
ncbi:hypothetical protein [Nocardia suismassiliense]|uniref:hypothetical protein n=1 Tax=Nocardia suismassiliense TaxID=2077092 RepID=UPI00131ED4E4|nr:hypothetical protein [Nocardia suismassiliense]